KAELFKGADDFCNVETGEGTAAAEVREEEIPAASVGSRGNEKRVEEGEVDFAGSQVEDVELVVERFTDVPCQWFEREIEESVECLAIVGAGQHQALADIDIPEAVGEARICPRRRGAREHQHRRDSESSERCPHEVSPSSLELDVRRPA